MMMIRRMGKLDAGSYTLAVLIHLSWIQLTRNVYGISDEVLLPVQWHQHFLISSRNRGSLIAFVFYTSSIWWLLDGVTHFHPVIKLLGKFKTQSPFFCSINLYFISHASSGWVDRHHEYCHLVTIYNIKLHLEGEALFRF